jgi:hypothetical protein
MRTGRIYQRSHRRFTFVQIEENMIALENPKFSQEQLARNRQDLRSQMGGLWQPLLRRGEILATLGVRSAQTA